MVAKKSLIFLVIFVSPISFGLTNSIEGKSKDYCEGLDYEYIIQKTVIGDVGYCKFSEHDNCLAESFLDGECGGRYSSCAKNGYVLGMVYDNELCLSTGSSKCAVCVLDDGNTVFVTDQAIKKSLPNLLGIVGFATCENCSAIKSVLIRFQILLLLTLIIGGIVLVILWQRRRFWVVQNKNIIVIALVILIVFGLSSFLFSPLLEGGVGNGVLIGEGIKNAEIEDDLIRITLKEVLSNEQISKIGFEIADKSGHEYSIDVVGFKNTYDLRAEDFGLNNFKSIKAINAVFHDGIIDDLEQPFNSIAEASDLVESNYKSCSVDLDCKDDVSCTVYKCLDGFCMLESGEACDDGDYCNGVEYCDRDKGCVSGSPLDCSDMDDTCNFGVCDEENKGCAKVPILESELNVNCSQNNTSQDIYSQGIVTCDDDIYCNGVETFIPGGGCTPGTEVNCSHFDNERNTGVCSEELKDCKTEAKADFTRCDDGGECSVNDFCMRGDCIGMIKESICDDGVSCTEDKCLGVNCVNTPKDNLCSSIQFCSITQDCVQNVCAGCSDCENFFSLDCNRDNCEDNCNLDSSCYFTANSNNLCILESDVCTEQITECANYSLENCDADFCSLGCHVENSACVVIDPCKYITDCSNFSSDSECGENNCSIDCQWKNNICKFQNLTHGTGGHDPGLYERIPISVDGVSTEYHLSVPEMERPGILVWLHGDGAKSYLYNNTNRKRVSQVARERNLLLINIRSPYRDRNGGRSWWWGNEDASAKLIHTLIQDEIYKKYNIDQDRFFISGVSGGPGFMTSHFIPYYGKYYRGGAIPMCGGHRSVINLNPSQEFINDFKIYFHIQTGDWLIDIVSGAIRQYRSAGFNVTAIHPRGGSHCSHNNYDVLSDALDFMDN